VRDRLVPREAEVAELDEIPSDIRNEMQALGLFGLTVPEAYGGLGLTLEEEVLAVQELGRTSPAFRSLIGTNNGIGSQGIVIDGTEDQKQRWLPKIASGEYLTSFCLTEPEAGSDAGSLEDPGRARRRPLRPQRHQALHHQFRSRLAVHGDGPHRSDREGRRRRVGLHRRARYPWTDDRQAREKIGPAGRAHLRRDLRGLPRAGLAPDRRSRGAWASRPP
jgi:hypothetical protein